MNIPVKYIDTRKYIVTASYDDYDDNPADWGNFTIVTFGRRLLSDVDSDEYYTESGKLKPKYQAKVKAGKMFLIDLYEHSGYSFSLAGEGMNCRFDTSHGIGFIIFEDEYIKDMNYTARRLQAQRDLDTYNQYINGQVYIVDIKTDTGLEIDCIGGIYDIDEHVKNELGDVDYEVIYG